MMLVVVLTSKLDLRLYFSRNVVGGDDEDCRGSATLWMNIAILVISLKSLT
jgi:hypothetical protein